jgi:hypothetical protein
MKKALYLSVAAAALFAMILMVGCKTTVPVTYTEPARLNLSGVSRIAIDSGDSQVVATISQKLTETGKYTVASAAELSEWKQWKVDRQAMEELVNYQSQAVEIGSTELVAAYLGNAVRADSSYLGKPLKITAIVKEIGKSSRGNYFVRLEGAGSDSVDVFFAASEISALAAVDKDQTITIIGECRGFNPPDMEDTAEIIRLLGGGRSINMINARFPINGLKDYPGAVDAVIFLNATSSVQDSSHTERRVAQDSNGNNIIGDDGKPMYRNVTLYDRNVTVNISYQIVRARDSSPIGSGTKSATSGNSSSEERAKLPAPAELVARIINRPLSEFISEIVPTQRSISITLAKESDNKEAKKEMSAAEKLVKAKNYADAAAAYGKIYAAYKNFAAGYNHAVLTEAAMGTEVAVELMEALVKETDNHPMAQSALRDMRSRNAGNQRAADQLSK